MADFKGRHYQGAIILSCVRWYCKYGISYRDLEEMMVERGVEVDHTTLYRWVQRYAPEMEKRLRYFWSPTLGYSWRVDETYIKVKGKWKYLYRAVDSQGNTIDFYLSSTRNTHAAKRFLGKALRRFKNWQKPQTINTDKAPAYAAAIKELKDEGACPQELEHRQIKYLNNIVEADHGKLKRLIKPTLGFKSMKTAYATIKGFELMRMFKKGQMKVWTYGRGIIEEVRLVERQFGIYNAYTF
jgi:transposase-like protein